MSIIYHITTNQTWNAARKKDIYDFCALKTEGFIHCSTFQQTIDTANRFFKEQEDLIVLEIEVAKVKSDVVFESVPDADEIFPHIYGELNIDAVKSLKKLEKDKTGNYSNLVD